MREPIIGATLTSWLLTQQRKGHLDDEHLILLTSIATACRRIASLVARAPLDGMVGLAASATANASGDAQKKLVRTQQRRCVLLTPCSLTHTRTRTHTRAGRHRQRRLPGCGARLRAQRSDCV